MGSDGTRRRKPRRRLAPAAPYVRAPKGGVRWTWRLGGPLTNRNEAEARRRRTQGRPGRLGRFVLRVLGYR